MEDYGAATLRPNTLRSYEQFIRCYIKPYLGDKIVSRVTRMDIQKLYRKLKHEGRVHDHPEHGHELSDTMVLRIHAMLHQCLKDAEAAHVVARNPTDGAVVPKASYKPKQILTKEQMDTFLAAVDRNEIWRDFFYTELTTGLRRGELLALQWDDCDFERGILTLRGESAKKGKTEYLPMTAATRAILEGVRRTESPYVFPGRNGSKRQDFRRMAWRVKKKAGLPEDFRPLHGLRHNFASRLASSGQVDMYTLQKLLTHESPQMTQRYAHLRDEALRRAASLADSLLLQQNEKDEQSIEDK